MLHVQAMEEYAALGLLPQRAAGWVAGCLRRVGLLLAGTRLYGTIAFSTSQRTREIGIRLALGATPRDVLAHILWQGMKLALIGVALGITLSLVATRLLAGLLFGISPQDPLVLVAVVAGLAGEDFAASYLPARRAARLDPAIALRYE